MAGTGDKQGQAQPLGVFNADDLRELLPVKGKEEVNAVYVIGLVYNPSTLSFELPTKPNITVEGDLTVTMGDLEKLLSENYWKDQRLEYSSGDIIYKGLNTSHKAATSATTWYIWKYTWDGDDCTRIEGPLTGSWDGRAGLAWAE